MDPQDRIELVVPRLQGWCPKEKALHLMNLINTYRPATIVEIGVFGGRSLLPIVITAEALKLPGSVYGVDPWQPTNSLEGMAEPENREWWSKLDHEAIFQKYCSDCLTYLTPKEIDRLKTMRMTSAQALEHFEDGSIDLLHQDGNHSESVCLPEVLAWYPKLKPGSVWVFDDIAWPSTAKAVEQIKAWCNTISETYLLDGTTYGIYQVK